MKANIGKKVEFQWTRRNVVGIVEEYDGSENTGKVIVRPVSATSKLDGKPVPLGSVPKRISLTTSTLQYCN